MIDESIYEQFYEEIEDHYNVQLRRNVRKDWENYWAWSVL